MSSTTTAIHATYAATRLYNIFSAASSSFVELLLPKNNGNGTLTNLISKIILIITVYNAATPSRKNN